MSERERRKTTTRSFRVDETALVAIENDAAKANVSVNAFVNQLLLSYYNFDRYFGQFQMIKISTDGFVYLLGSVPDEAAGEAGRRTALGIVRSVILAKHGSLDLNTVLDYLRMMSEYGKIYTLVESKMGGKRAVTLVHSLGTKGSIYYTQYLATVFGMIGLKPKVTATEKAVTASF